MDTKSATKLSSIALLSFILASCNEDDLKIWLASSPIDPPMTCPTAPLQPSATPTPPGGAARTVPYFKFGKVVADAITNGGLLSCIEDGPYTWDNMQWYVQRIRILDDQRQQHYAIRACSTDAVPDKYGPARDLVVETPGGPLQNVSENHCQMLASG